MTEKTVLKEDLIGDIVEATSDVLSTMASFEVKAKEFVQRKGTPECLDITACMDITGILGFSGGRKGSVLITFTEAIALKVVGGMLGVKLSKIDADVRDGVGEIVNMIAGGAKTRLQRKGVFFDLSIPNTIIGQNHQITAPASAVRTRIDFESCAGDFFMEVHLKED